MSTSSGLTRKAILGAIEEFDRLGRPEFLKQYGFGGANRFLLRHEGHDYDAKAIVGVAFKFLSPNAKPLTWDDFGSRENTTKKWLEELDFTVVSKPSRREASIRNPQTNHEERAFLCWTILVECAKHGETIRYGALAERLGIHHRVIRYVLEPIQAYCLEQELPPLTILALDRNGQRGAGFTAWSRDNIEEGEQLVFARNWALDSNPFEFAANGESEEQLVTQLLARSESSQEIYAKVKVRGVVQRLFREATKRAYGERCAITGISIGYVLEAAHIVPWSSCTRAERIDPRNGILLSSTFHKLFDCGLLQIKGDYTLHVTPKLQKHMNGCEYTNRLLSKMNGRRIYLPQNESLWPSPESLRKGTEVRSARGE